VSKNRASGLRRATISIQQTGGAIVCSALMALMITTGRAQAQGCTRNNTGAVMYPASKVQPFWLRALM
jgi:hypothetical protein